MGEAYLDWQKKSGGIKLNDVIEEYRYVAAGKAVKAGDLVNYINGIAGKVDYGESVDTQLSSIEKTSATMSAVALDNGRVFVAYCYGSDKYLYGMIVTINGATISAGIETQLSTTGNTGSGISACLLQNGNVFIAHSYNPTHLYGMVIVIDGTTITVGTDTALNANNGMGLEISTCLLPNGNVFIAHSYGTYSYLYGMVVTVAGITLTKGTDTLIVSNDYRPGYRISTCLLNDGNVFIAHGHGGTSNLQLYGIVCTISGRTITKGTDTAIIPTNYAGEDIAICTLTNGNVFIAHNIGGNNNLGGIVCKISGTTITAGGDTTISTTKYTGQGLSVVSLPNEKVFIAYRRNNSPTYLNGVVCSISDTTIAKGVEKNLNTADFTGGEPEIALLPNGIVFIAHTYSTSSYLYAQIFAIDEANNIPTNNIVVTEYEQQVTPAIEPPFNAVALSSGVGGTDTEHNEQVKIARVYKEVTRVEIIQEDTVPKYWIKNSNSEYTASTNGDKLSFGSDSSNLFVSDNTSLNYPLNYMCDGNVSKSFEFGTKGTGTANAWIIYESHAPIAISKIKVKCSQLSPDIGSVNYSYFQGSNDGEIWETLHTFTENTDDLTEITINNTKEWNKYRFYMNVNLPGGNYGGSISFYEFQVSEYIKTVTEVIQ